MRSIAAALSFASALLLVSHALAAPGLVPLQGVLTTLDGTPVEGPTPLHFALYASESAATPWWSETQTVDLDAGFFTVYLGDTTDLDMALFADAPGAWIGVGIGDDAELPRLPLGEAGRAGYAQVCGDSESLGGLSADAFAFAAGDGLTLAGGTVALNASGCAPGDVLKRSPAGDAWTCSPDLLGTGGAANAIGAGLVLAGDTLSVSQSTIEGWARGVCFDTTAELTTALAGEYMSVDYTPAWGELTGIPTGFADGIDDVASYEGGEGVVIDGGVISLSPAQTGALGGVAAGDCAPGKVVVGIDTAGTITCAPAQQGGGPSLPPLAATAPTKLTPGSGFNPVALASDADFIYYATTTEAGRVPIAGGLPQSLSSGHSKLVGVAVSSTHVYFAEFALTSSTGFIGRVPKGGGATETIVASVPSAQRPTGLLLDGSTLFWGSDAGLIAVSDAGGTPFAYDTGKAEFVTHDATDFWFLRNGLLTRLALGGGTAQAVARVGNATALAAGTNEVLVATSSVVVRVPKAGGRTRLLLTTSAPVSQLLVHEGWAYAATSNGILLAIAADGSTQPDTIAVGGVNVLHAADGALRFSGSSLDGTGILSFPTPPAL